MDDTFLLTVGPLSHPASACCRGVVTTPSTIRTPSNVGPDNMAIIAIAAVFSSCVWFRLYANLQKVRFLGDLCNQASIEIVFSFLRLIKFCNYLHMLMMH